MCDASSDGIALLSFRPSRASGESRNPQPQSAYYGTSRSYGFRVRTLARAPRNDSGGSELPVERVLYEVVKHAVGLLRGAGVILGDALHHGLFLGERMQAAAEVELLPIGAGAVELSFERVAVGLRRHRVLRAVHHEHRG